MLKKMITLAVLMAFLGVTTYASADVVFATKNGTKYHHQICPLIKNKGAEQIDKAQAVQKGLTHCKRCFKEDLKEDTSMKQGLKDKKS